MLSGTPGSLPVSTGTGVKIPENSTEPISQAKPWGQIVSYVRCPDGTLVELCTPVAAGCAQRPAKTADVAAYVAMNPLRQSDSLATVTVCVVVRSPAVRVGSYHGELFFDSTSVRIVRVEKATGGMRVENATLPGRVNFAGAAPEGFPPGAIVRVVLRVRPRGKAPALRLAMRELNAVDGKSLLPKLVTSGLP